MPDRATRSPVASRPSPDLRRPRVGPAAAFAAILSWLAVVGYQAAAQAPAAPAEPRDRGYDFVSRVLAATEDVWAKVFKTFSQTYAEPKLVLYNGVTPAACGTIQSISGPVYCEMDNRVYLDLSFFRELELKHGAAGDFARAYVIAHEIGHHVQNLLGILQQSREVEARLDERERNALSVRVELQADCLAGVWAGVARAMWPNMIEPGDIESGLAAAAAIGADRLQKAALGVVVPESFTHGTSEQRMRWFRRGLDRSEIAACDTFNAPDL